MTASPLAIAPATTEDSAAALRADWDRLLTDSPASSVFQSWEWAMSWWKAFKGPDRALLILAVKDGDRTVAIVPWVITTRRLRGVVPFRTIEFLGSETVNGDHLDFLSAPGVDPSQLAASVISFLRQPQCRWDLIRLDSVPSGSPMPTAFVGAAQATGLRASSRQLFVCPATRLPVSWKDIRSVVREGSFREVEYKARRLSRQAEWHVTMCKPSEVAAGLEVLFDLHAKRWQLREKPGAFRNSAKQDFYNEACSALAERNWLRFHMLHVNGAPAAALLCFKFGRTYASMQNGFDPQWAKHSVGQILLSKVMEQAISEGCDTFDFLRGTDPYKYEWGAVDRPALRVEVERPNLKNGLIRMAAAGRRILTRTG